MLSGLSTALTQRALVGLVPRNALFFSAELALYGILFLVLQMNFSADGRKVTQNFTNYYNESIMYAIHVELGASSGAAEWLGAEDCYSCHYKCVRWSRCGSGH